MAAHSGVDVRIGRRTSKRNACIGTTSIPSRAARAGAPVRSPRRALPKRSSVSARPSVVPYAPHEAGPTLKRWIASSEKWTSIGTSSAGSRPSRPRPGAATKKSSTWFSPGACTTMNPPAPGPVSGDSATNDISTAATAASTALPPARSTSAPACAVSGWPAATTPFMWASLAARKELGHVNVHQRPGAHPLAGAAHVRLGVGRDAATLTAPPLLVARPRAVHGPVAVAGGHDRDPHLVVDLVVDHGAEDDVRVRVRRLGHRLRGLVDLPEREVAAAGDREQNRARPLQRGLQQRRLDRVLDRVHRAAVTRAHADAEQRLTRLGHDRPDVGEVEVDEARQRDQVGDALHALAQDVVRHPEGVDHRSGLVEHREQARVRDYDQRVDLAGEVLHALVGLLAAARALERERLGHDSDGERTDLTGDARHDRRRTGAGAAARARGDEHHVRSLELALDLVVVLDGRGTAEVRVRARAQSTRGVAADVQPGAGGRALERLDVGVHRDELHALHLSLDHAVDGVHAGTTDAHHPQHRLGGVHRMRGHERLRVTVGLTLDGGNGVALEDVLRDVLGEDGLEALLRARHALVAAPALLALSTALLALLRAASGLGPAAAQIRAPLRGRQIGLAVRL